MPARVGTREPFLFLEIQLLDATMTTAFNLCACARGSTKFGLPDDQFHNSPSQTRGGKNSPSSEFINRLED